MKEELKLGSKLKHYRVVSKKSQQEIADILGVDRVTYSKYENNKTVPPFDFIVRFSEVLGIEINAFATNQVGIKALSLPDQDLIDRLEGMKDIEEVKTECRRLIVENSALKKEITDLEKDMVKIIRDLR